MDFGEVVLYSSKGNISKVQTSDKDFMLGCYSGSFGICTRRLDKENGPASRKIKIIKIE